MVTILPAIGADRSRGEAAARADRPPPPPAIDPTAATKASSSAGLERPAKRLSILVPIRNEARNVEPLVARLERAVAGLDAEIVFVDDGDDDSADRIRRLASRSTVPLRLLARPPGEREGGLGGAVVAGIEIAAGGWVCVIDGDLQHPPELVPCLLAAAESAGLDLVLASRFAPGAVAPGLGSARRSTARSLAFLVRALFPDRLAGVTDPLTGFFLVRREAVDPRRLEPDGFKILLQILVVTSGLAVGEIPFRFAEREAERSKAGLVEVIRLGRTVARLSRRAHARLARFLAVGASGFAVNNAAMAVLVELSAVHYLAAAVAATAITTIWNFLLTELWVFGYRGRKGERFSRFAVYAGVSVLGLAARSPLLFALTSVLGLHYLASNALSIAALTGIRYALSARWIWRPPTPEVKAAIDRGATP